MFNDPFTISVRLDELDGQVVALRKTGDGSPVTRQMDDGRKVTSTPIRAEVLVYANGSVKKEHTLIFPESLQETVEAAAPGYALGTVTKEDHPSKAGWTIWTVQKLDGPERDEAVAAFTAAIV